jgi:EF hand
MLTRRIAIFAGLGVAFCPLLPALSASDPDLLAGLDTDHDGTVSLDEAKKAAEVMFDKLDRDHDGTLTGRELRGKTECEGVCGCGRRQGWHDKQRRIPRRRRAAVQGSRYG